MDCGPNIFPCPRDRIENSFVPLFPYFPEDEAWEQLPDSIENGRVENRASPILNSFLWAQAVSIRSSHDASALIPYARVVGAEIEEMI